MAFGYCAHKQLYDLYASEWAGVECDQVMISIDWPSTTKQTWHPQLTQ